MRVKAAAPAAKNNRGDEADVTAPPTPAPRGPKPPPMFVQDKDHIAQSVSGFRGARSRIAMCPVLHHHPQAEDTVRCPPNRKPLIAQRRDPGAAGVAPSAARAPATRPALIARGPAAPRLPRCAIYIYIYYIYSYPSSRR
ncbi:hypothetical protein EVAR_87891_1 [Eumeta japonica]|uniref:Uncharacterized protein n=1 Tax=Eumeta variegata TaxID=151549 RepID=A0A4C1WTT9_EUMVA|nr:hypothetical protein EVAR_87891_1 [Eumeta japonica]